MNHGLHRLKLQITQIILLVSGFWFLVSSNFAQPPNYVRVAIIQDAASLSLKIKGFYEITDSDTGRILSQGRNLKTTVTGSKSRILIGRNNFSADKVLLSTVNKEVIAVNGRLFRGSIQIIKNNNAKFLVVNHIDLESYIKGILYNETSHYWPSEALKAQAVASRTYALYHIQQNRLKAYDVTSDISQVYGGRASERYRTNMAVTETRGEVLVYQNRVIPAYFHTACGGRTEDVSLVWNMALEPLKGVVCDFCKDSPHFSWHYILPLKELKDKLISAGFKVGSIKEIAVEDKDSSGRITNLKLICGKDDLEVSAKDFRNVIGPNLIKSANFNVNVVEADAVFEGFGWGHGVGLCQWGAYFMAKQGWTYKQILEYYYHGSELSRFD